MFDDGVKDTILRECGGGVDLANDGIKSRLGSARRLRSLFLFACGLNLVRDGLPLLVDAVLLAVLFVLRVVCRGDVAA